MDRERIILAPGVSETEFLRMMALFGKNSFGLRVVSPSELAVFALMRSGITIAERPITTTESVAFIYGILQEKRIRYFENSSSYLDAKQIFNAIVLLRSLIAEDEERVVYERLSSGEFPEKNLAVLEIYREYMSMLKNKGCIDKICLIRKAIELSSPIGLEVLEFEEFPLSLLEKRLLEKLTEGKSLKKNLSSFFGRRVEEYQVEYTKAYGAVNEVEDIFKTIFSDTDSSLDKCIVATTNPPVYAQLFYDFSILHDIPVTFGCGIPIVNSNPAKLLKQFDEWDGPRYNGIDGYRKLVNCEAFNRWKLGKEIGLSDSTLISDLNRVIEIAGSLRLSFSNKFSDINKSNDEKIRDYRIVLEKKAGIGNEDQALSGNKEQKEICRKLELLGMVQKLADEFKAGFPAFFSKYCVIREEAKKLDASALASIHETLSLFCSESQKWSIDIFLDDILGSSVCQETCREGALHIATIQDAFASMRENLFICGLSSSEFPGKVQENFVLLDSDLEFALHEKYSQKKIRDKTQQLRKLIDFASVLDVKIRLSYSAFDLAELKQKNPSSVVLELYVERNTIPKDKSVEDCFRSVGFFDSGLSPAFDGGFSYSSGHKIAGKGYVHKSEIDSKQLLEKYWSPTSLEVFFGCPRRFYLTKVLGIPDESPDKPADVINAADFGSLAHEAMEIIANKSISKNEFLQTAEKLFDDFLVERPPLNPSDVIHSKEDFMNMMGNAYDMDPKNKVIFAEEEIREEHPSGIRLKGIPDRIEETDNGKLLIADYKTKRNVAHFTDRERMDSCFQILVYAWLCEQKMKRTVSDCEYRYIRFNDSNVEFSFDQEYRNFLDNKLAEFRKAIDSNSFPRKPGDKNTNCRYCNLKDICVWPEDSVIPEDGEDD